MRRIRLRQWLALLLRTLVIALVVAAYARPAYRSGAGWGGQNPPVAAVVLVDVSYSTGFRMADGALFAGLQRQALALLEMFGDRDQATLVPFAAQARAIATAEPARLADAVRGLAVTEEATDLATALGEAVAVLSKAKPGTERELYLVTDLARHDWPELGETVTLPADLRVYVAAPRVPERLNLHADGVRVLSWMPAAGRGLDLEALVTNTSPRAVEGVGVDLYLDNERVGHQELSLAAGEQARVRFRVTPRRAGRLAGFVELEDDALVVDNRCYFTLDLPERVSVLVVGASSADTYYPARALASAATADPTLRANALLLADLGAATLQDVDVVLLCSLEGITPTNVGLLRDFTASGGGLVAFLGPRADLSSPSRDLLSGLLPASLEGVAGSPGQQSAFQVLDPVATHHPLFDDLVAGPAGDPPRFYAFYNLRPGPSAETWVRLTGGQPAIVSAPLGAGRTVLVSVPLSLDWSDLPLRGAFVPLLHRLTRELCLNGDHHLSYLVGQEARRRPTGVAPDRPVEAEAPSGARFALEPEAAPGGPRWRLPRLDQAGLWRLRQEGREVDAFPVNLDTRESVLTPVDSTTVRRTLGKDRVVFLEPGKDPRLQVAATRFGRELWREFLLLALGLLLLELWIARAPRDRSPAAAPVA